MSIAVTLNGDAAAFLPGDVVTGKVAWDLPHPPKSIDLVLFWYTTGKGIRDVGEVAQEKVASSLRQGEHSFSFTLPQAPYSFSGKLITLTWAVEAVVHPGKEDARVEFVLSPTGEEVRL